MRVSEEIRLGRRMEDKIRIGEEILAAIGIGALVFFCWLALHLG